MCEACHPKIDFSQPPDAKVTILLADWNAQRRQVTELREELTELQQELLEATHRADEQYHRNQRALEFLNVGR